MMQPLDPVAALREIAYLMERVQADSRRVKAFRTAADVVAALNPEADGPPPGRRHVAGDSAGWATVPVP